MEKFKVWALRLADVWIWEDEKEQTEGDWEEESSEGGGDLRGADLETKPRKCLREKMCYHEDWVT